METTKHTAENVERIFTERFERQVKPQTVSNNCFPY